MMLGTMEYYDKAATEWAERIERGIKNTFHRKANGLLETPFSELCSC